MRAIGGVKIQAVVTCTPGGIIANSDLTSKSQKIAAAVGVGQRRKSDGELTSDLCVLAAKELFKNSETRPEEIDALIFVTQTPDFQIPSTAPLIALQLNLREEIASYDVNQGCSGFVSAVDLGASLLSAGFRNILLAVGDTVSRVIGPEDHAGRALFGDGASATLLTRTECEEDKICLYSWVNGKGSGDIRIKNYGVSGRERFVESDRNSYLELNGANIFSFAISKVPKAIESVLAEMKVEKADCVFAFHQANRMINSHLEKKMGLNSDQVLNSIEHFGNTSSASIPLSLTHSRLNLSRYKYLCLVGFGVGLSISVAVCTKPDSLALEHVDYA